MATVYFTKILESGGEVTEFNKDVVSYNIASRTVMNDKYAQEPKRVDVTVQHLYETPPYGIDGTALDAMINGTDEYDNNVFKFRAFIISNGKTVINGYVDTTTVDYDDKEKLLSFTIYDVLGLLVAIKKDLEVPQTEINRGYTRLSTIWEKIQGRVFGEAGGYKYFSMANLFSGLQIDSQQPLTVSNMDVYDYHILDNIPSLPDEWEDWDQELDYYDYKRLAYYAPSVEATFLITIVLYTRDATVGDREIYLRGDKIFNNGAVAKKFYEFSGYVENASANQDQIIRNKIRLMVNDSTIEIPAGFERRQKFTNGTVFHDYNVDNAEIEVLDNTGAFIRFTTTVTTYRAFVKFTGNISPEKINYGEWNNDFTDWYDNEKTLNLLDMFKTSLLLRRQVFYVENYSESNYYMKIKSIGLQSMTADITLQEVDVLTRHYGRHIPAESVRLSYLSGEKEAHEEAVTEIMQSYFASISTVTIDLLYNGNIDLLEVFQTKGKNFLCTSINHEPQENLYTLEGWR